MRKLTRKQVIKRKRACNFIGMVLIFIGIVGALSISSPTGGVTIYNVISIAMLGMGAFLVSLASSCKVK